MSTVADVIDALATFLPSETVEGYPNHRLAHFFLWLDNDRPWWERETGLFAGNVENSQRSNWGPKAWEKLYGFYLSAASYYYRTYEGEKLTTQDWAQVRQESLVRYRSWAQDAQTARQAESYRLEELARQERQQLREQEAADKEAAWWQRMNAGEIVYGPADWEPSPELLTGQGALIRTGSGYGPIAEVQVGHYVQSNAWFGDVWAKVTNVYRSTGEKAWVYYQVTKDHRREGDMIMEDSIRSVSPTLPPGGRLY